MKSLDSLEFLAVAVVALQVLEQFQFLVFELDKSFRCTSFFSLIFCLSHGFRFSLLLSLLWWGWWWCDMRLLIWFTFTSFLPIFEAWRISCVILIYKTNMVVSSGFKLCLKSVTSLPPNENILSEEAEVTGAVK